jgi:hypothetical protein
MIQLGLNIHGERQFFDRYDRFVETIADQRERGWQGNVDVRLDHQRRHMDTENAGGWTPLTDSYRLRKVEAVGAIPILQFTTHMYRSLTEEGADDYIREEEADSLRVGSSDPKARWHHEGRGRLPVREVIVITDAEGREHLEVMEEGYEHIASRLGIRVL